MRRSAYSSQDIRLTAIGKIYEYFFTSYQEVGLLWRCVPLLIRPASRFTALIYDRDPADIRATSTFLDLDIPHRSET